MTFEQWRALCGNQVVDGRGEVWRVIGLITDPAAIIESGDGKRSTVVIDSMVGREFKADRRGGDDRRRSEN